MTGNETSNGADCNYSGIYESEEPSDPAAPAWKDLVRLKTCADKDEPGRDKEESPVFSSAVTQLEPPVTSQCEIYQNIDP